jgi:hypothetical protein
MRRLLVVVLAALITAGCATHALTSGRVVVRDDRAATTLRFSDRDAKIIREYYREPRASKKRPPPGLAKRETLPPGLASRDTLPPGLQGRSLPPDLERRLTVLPEGTVRHVFGRDIVLLQRHMRVVLDVLYGVVPD